MIILFIVLYIATYYVPDGIIYGLTIEALIASLALSCFLKTDYENPIEKSGWFCVSLYTITNAAFFTWFDESVPSATFMIIFESSLFTLMYIYSQYRSYDLGTDEYNSEDVFIVLKSPRNFLDYFISCVFNPISSISVVIAGEKYGFEKKKPFRPAKYQRKTYHSFVKINLNPEAVRKSLLFFLGEKWKPLKNCCHVVQGIFPSYKFGVLDSLPSYMTRTILKIRG